METLLIWGLALIAAALVLTVIEVFVPSAGLIAVVAAGLGIAGVVCLFRHDALWGMAGLLVLIVLAPVIFFFGLHVMPSTPVGKRLLFGETGKDLTRPSSADGLGSVLIGAEAEAVTDLRPIGSIMLDGKRVSASSEGAIIPAGTRVRVVAVDGANIRVRPVAQ